MKFLWLIIETVLFALNVSFSVLNLADGHSNAAALNLGVAAFLFPIAIMYAVACGNDMSD